MNAIKDVGPAFPIGSGDMRDTTGVTLRDYFAANAVSRYIMADAMLKAREVAP